MGLPAKQRTSSSKRQRASHFALKPTNTTKCEKCGAEVLPHHACPKCGYYRGKKVIKVEKRTERLLKHRKQIG